MPLFAAPDFGSAGSGLLCMMVVAAVMVVLALAGLYAGIKMLRKHTPMARRFGWLLILTSLLMPVACGFGPSFMIRVLSGNLSIPQNPDEKVSVGMSQDEVRSALGNPHQRDHIGNNEERWFYFADLFGWNSFGMSFGPTGKVTSTYRSKL